MRTSFIFYSSFYEALEDLPQETQLQLYRAITKYSLFNEELELEGIANTIFKLIKPQLDANNKRYEDGKKGGRPKKTTGYEKEKPVVTKNKTTGYEKEKPNNNVNVNDNDNVNVNDNSSSSEEILKEDEEFSVTKEDEELLIKFAKEKNNIKYPRPWLRKLAKNGDTAQVLERAKSWQKILKKKEEEKVEESKERTFGEMTPEEQLEEERQIKEIQQRIRTKLNTLCKPIKNL